MSRRDPSFRARDSRSGRRPRRRKGELTPEERTLRDARRRANAKLSFYTHLFTYASVLVMLIVVTRSLRVALIVGACWGIGLAIHYFAVMVAPSLRERLIEEEVGKQVRQGVDRERRAIGTRNLRSLEDLSASIAHEIRNPITAAKSLVQQMGEDPVSAENIESAKVALDELDRVERSISHLLRYARDTELRATHVQMADLVESTLDSFRERADRLGVETRLEIDAPGRVVGDDDKLRRVLVNLMGNALDALESAGVPDPVLEVAMGENLAGSEVWIRIRDNGPGIPGEAAAQIFSPFFTTKQDGTGLGLALSKKVIDAHGGGIEVHSSPEEGSEFILTLPTADVPSARDRGRPA